MQTLPFLHSLPFTKIKRTPQTISALFLLTYFSDRKISLYWKLELFKNSTISIEILLVNYLFHYRTLQYSNPVTDLFMFQSKYNLRVLLYHLYPYKYTELLVDLKITNSRKNYIYYILYGYHYINALARFIE